MLLRFISARTQGLATCPITSHANTNTLFLHTLAKQQILFGTGLGADLCLLLMLYKQHCHNAQVLGAKNNTTDFTDFKFMEHKVLGQTREGSCNK